MSQGPEANFWNTIRKQLPQNCYAWRIENRVTAGMPDVYMIWDGIPLWIEMKTTSSNRVNLSPQQIAWHTSHSHVGGFSAILVKRTSDRCLFLFEGRGARSVASEGLCSGAIFSGTSVREALDAVRGACLEHLAGVLRPCGPAP